jgi:hypothetical protein
MESGTDYPLDLISLALYVMDSERATDNESSNFKPLKETDQPNEFLAKS